MILTAEFEAKESVPPAVWAQVRRALCATLEMYGLQPTIRENRAAELAAYQRYWVWAADERAKRGLNSE